MGQTISTPDWASQKTLDRIASATERSASSLASLLSGKTDGFSELVDGAKKAGQSLLQDTAEGRKTQKQLRDLELAEAKRDLRNKQQAKAQNDAWDRRSRQSVGESFNQAGARLTDGSALLTHTTQRITGALHAIPVAGAVLGGMLGAVTGLISSVMKSKDTFIDMVDSGILFGGSLTQFRIGLGNAGLSTEQFAAIVQQSGQGISVLGERRFLDSTTRLRGFFDEFGLSINQGNEYFGQYIENARLSGSLYLRTMGEHEQSFKDNMTLMREQARITGVSVRQQREQQQNLMRDARFQALLRSVSPERRQYMESQVTAITATAGEQGAQFAKEFFSMATLGNVERGGMLQTLMSFGGAVGPLQELAARVRSGDQVDTGALMDTIMRIPPEVFAAVSLRQGPEAERIMALRQRAEARARGEEMAPPPSSRLTPETQALVGAQNTITQLTAQFNAAITQLGEHLIRIVTPALTTLNNTLVAFSTAQPGQGIQAMLRSLAGPQAPGAEPNALQRIASSFDQGFMSGIGQTLKEALRGAWNLLLSTLELAWESLLQQLREWRDQFVTALSNLIPSWMRGSEAQRNVNAQAAANREAMTPEQEAAARRMAPASRVGLGTRYFTDAIRNISRIEESVERSGSLNAQQQQQLQQQIANLQTIRTGLEAQTNRSTTEQELLQRIADSIDNGNRRLTTAVREGS